MILPPWDQTATAPEQCELLAALVRCHKPLCVVEAGTYKGHAAIFMGLSVKANGKGRVFTADVEDWGVTEWTVENNLQNEVFVNAGRDFLDLLRVLDRVDFAYIDASGPGEDGARLRLEHFDAVLPKLTEGGLICVDDTRFDGWKDGQGGLTAATIRGRCQINFQFLRGLSIFQKP